MIDFHNYGFTLLAPTIAGHPGRGLATRVIIAIAKYAEMLTANLFGRNHAAFCVSQAMKQELQRDWKIKLVFMNVCEYVCE